MVSKNEEKSRKSSAKSKRDTSSSNNVLRNVSEKSQTKGIDYLTKIKIQLQGIWTSSKAISIE